MKSISVIIPTWNEIMGIEKTINSIPKNDLISAGYKCADFGD